jgi:DNA-binding transcriptional LysR family regulator
MAVTAVKKAFPRIRVNIDLYFSEALVRRLLDRGFAIVIATSPHRKLRNWISRLGEEPHSIVARADHPLVRKRDLALRPSASMGCCRGSRA